MYCILLEILIYINYWHLQWIGNFLMLKILTYQNYLNYEIMELPTLEVSECIGILRYWNFPCMRIPIPQNNWKIRIFNASYSVICWNFLCIGISNVSDFQNIKISDIFETPMYWNSDVRCYFPWMKITPMVPLNVHLLCAHESAFYRLYISSYTNRCPQPGP